MSSTMDISRILAQRGEPHGTVITADLQEAARGRQGRPWVNDKGQNLMFTVLLRYADYDAIPRALTLKAGLAFSLALEDIFPALHRRIQVKWPNDIMLRTGEAFGKAAGILAEAEGSVVFLGAGINLAQKEFPGELQHKAASIINALEALDENAFLPREVSDLLLERMLFRLFEELENLQYDESWKNELEKRLYKKGELVTFIDGKADSAKFIKGKLVGIGRGGELLLIPEGEWSARSFITGELQLY